MEKIRFMEEGAYKAKSVVIRESRTMEETKKQVSHLIDLAISNGHRMNQIQDAYHRTFCALHATGRGGYTVKPGIKSFTQEKL